MEGRFLNSVNTGSDEGTQVAAARGEEAAGTFLYKKRVRYPSSSSFAKPLFSLSLYLSRAAEETFEWIWLSSDVNCN